jgi:SAM-dependent methyltransferase
MATLRDRTARVLGYLRGLHATHFLDVGVRMGLFGALADGPRSPADLAAALGLQERCVAAFCEMGFHLEVLDREGDGFRLAPDMDRLLASPDDLFYMGDLPRMHIAMGRDYARYPDLFRGGPAFPFQEHDREFLETVASASRSLPALLMEKVAPRMPSLVVKGMAGGRILDVGCGAGHALVAFAERFPRSRCAGLEIEPVSAELARERVRSRRLEDRVCVYERWEDLPGARGGYDLVTQFLVLHEIRPELKAEVIGRCAAALAPGGLMVLFDECWPADEQAARDPVLGFAVAAQWLELGWGNVINTREEILGLMAGAGLQPSEEAELSRFRIFTARKPAA